MNQLDKGCYRDKRLFTSALVEVLVDFSGRSHAQHGASLSLVEGGAYLSIFEGGALVIHVIGGA